MLSVLGELEWKNMEEKCSKYHISTYHYQSLLPSTFTSIVATHRQDMVTCDVGAGKGQNSYSEFGVQHIPVQLSSGKMSSPIHLSRTNPQLVILSSMGKESTDPPMSPTSKPWVLVMPPILEYIMYGRGTGTKNIEEKSPRCRWLFFFEPR